LIGTSKQSEEFILAIKKYFDWGLDIVGYLGDKNEMNKPTYHDIKYFGTYKNFKKILNTVQIDEVIIAVPEERFDLLGEIIQICETDGVQIRIISDYFGKLLKNIKVDVIYNLSIISIINITSKDWEVTVKTMFDKIVSLVLLIILLPLFLIISLVIKISSSGPILYNWRVIGMNKKPFVGYKFRTMIDHADSMKKDLTDQNEMSGPAFKIANDPRITKVGFFLRKYSLDELPQLWSVLKGDMSLVGPRPPLVEEFNEFDSWHRRKLSMKPGLTCLWQVNGRSTITDFNTWAKLDLEYIENWSFWLDMKILFKTIPAILSGRGAK